MEGIEHLIEIESQATARLHERNTPEVYPVVERPFRDAEAAGQLVDVDQRCSRVPNCERKLFPSERDIWRPFVVRIGLGEEPHALLYGIFWIPPNELV